MNYGTTNYRSVAMVNVRGAWGTVGPWGNLYCRYLGVYSIQCAQVCAYTRGGGEFTMSLGSLAGCNEIQYLWLSDV